MRRTWWVWLLAGVLLAAVGVALMIRYGQGIGCGAFGVGDGSTRIDPCEELIRTARRNFWLGAGLTLIGLLDAAVALGYRWGARASTPAP